VVALSVTIPSLLLGPLVGVWVDRWERRWTKLCTDGVRMVLVALFLLLALLVSDRSALLLGCVTVMVYQSWQ
jgi:MFS family permease